MTTATKTITQSPTQHVADRHDLIRVHGARENNLQDVSVEIPKPGRGRIDGVEAQAQTFFDFAFLPDWTHGFGAQANVTYLDAKTAFPDAAGAFTSDRILGVSKWTYNLVGFYERDGLTARLSYNKRGKFPDRRDNRGDDLYTETAIPAGRLDLSTNYTLFENLTVFFDWTNITGNPFKVNFSSARGGADRAEFVRFLRYEETTFSLGARFRI